MSEQGSERVRTRGTLISELSAAIGGLIGLFSIVAQVFDVAQPVVLIILIPLLAALGMSVFIIRRLYTVTAVYVNIALAGPPEIGKTVFVNTLCNLLMEGGSKLLSFSPDVQTAQQVYRTMGILRHGEWPGQTGTDQIARYRGRVAFRDRSLVRTMLNGPIEFRMEFGDSAGEDWNQLSNELKHRSPPRLIDSTYFQYIGDSDAIFYFIDCSNILKSPRYVDDQVDDLLSALQVLRTVEGLSPGSPLRKPIVLIFSKADLLALDDLESLSKFLETFSRDATSFESFESRQAWVEGIAKPTFKESLIRLERLFEVMASQSANFSSFIISSKRSFESRERTSFHRSSVAFELGLQPVEVPAEWVFERLWATRRFRPNRSSETKST